MNKTININLGSIIFHIDQTAYELLEGYLNEIRHYLSQSESKEEILSDIEARICELFLNRQKNDQQIISLPDVEEVIKIMGSPKDYDISEDDKPHDKKQKPFSFGRKLYRDTWRSVLGGVCMGIAHYTGITVILIRGILILMVLLSYGILIPIYILFWIIVPKAVSTADRLSMTGRPIDTYNIKEMRENLQEKLATGKKYYHSGRKRVNKFFEETSPRFLNRIFRFLRVLVGLALILVSVMSLIALIVLFSVFHGFLSILIDTFILAEYPHYLTFVFSLILVGVPILLVLLLGSYLSFKNFKPLNRWVLLIFTVLWIGSIISFSVVIGDEFAAHSHRGKSIQKDSYTINKKDTLTITSKRIHQRKNDFYDEVMTGYWSIVRDVDLHITSASDYTQKEYPSMLEINIEKYARADDTDQAIDYAKKISYKYQLTDNYLQLQSACIVSPEDKFREQKTDISLKVPQYIPFILDPSLKSIYHVRNLLDDTMYSKMSTDDVYKHVWMFVKESIVCLDCKELDGANFSEKKK